MHNIRKPKIENLEQHLENCIDKLRKTKIKTKFLIPEIVSQCNLYEQNASSNTLYLLNKIPFDDEIVQNQTFKKLYVNHMSKQSSCAYDLYNKLLSSAPFNKCPYCSQGDVEELDHFLPKTDNGYPEFSIVPINLVPSCHRCNHKKHEFIPTTKGNQFIHPYFINNINEYRWLYCRIDYNIENKPTFIFYVDCPNEIETSIQECINFQFNKLELAILYSKNAANEYAGIKNIIDKYHEEKGILIQLLNDRAISYENHIRNSWQTAMYYALVEEIEQNDNFI